MPEHNLIQRPDLIHRIVQFFGIRQAHITPTLAATVQPVVLVADLSRDLGQARAPGMVLGGRAPFMLMTTNAGSAGNLNATMLRNPGGSGVVIRVKNIWVDSPSSAWQLALISQPVDLANTFTIPCVDTTLPFRVQAANSFMSGKAVGSFGNPAGGPGFADILFQTDPVNFTAGIRELRESTSLNDLPVLVENTAIQITATLPAAVSNMHVAIRYTEEPNVRG